MQLKYRAMQKEVTQAEYSATPSSHHPNRDLRPSVVCSDKLGVAVGATRVGRALVVWRSGPYALFQLERFEKEGWVISIPELRQSISCHYRSSVVGSKCFTVEDK